MVIKTTVRGLPELRRALADLKLKIRKPFLRKALPEGARVYRDEAKRRTPVSR